MGKVTRRDFISMIMASVTVGRTKAELKPATHILPATGKAKVVQLKQEQPKGNGK